MILLRKSIDDLSIGTSISHLTESEPKLTRYQSLKTDDMCEGFPTVFDSVPAASSLSSEPVLHPGWEVFENEEGDAYYYHEDSGKSQWHPPTAGHLSDGPSPIPANGGVTIATKEPAPLEASLPAPRPPSVPPPLPPPIPAPPSLITPASSMADSITEEVPTLGSPYNERTLYLQPRSELQHLPSLRWLKTI